MLYGWGPCLQSLSRILESCLGFWYTAWCSLGFTSENFSSASRSSLGFQHLPQCSLELSLQGTQKKRPHCLSHGRQEDRGRGQVWGLGAFTSEAFSKSSCLLCLSPSLSAPVSGDTNHSCGWNHTVNTSTESCDIYMDIRKASWADCGSCAPCPLSTYGQYIHWGF